MDALKASPFVMVLYSPFRQILVLSIESLNLDSLFTLLATAPRPHEPTQG